MTYKIAYATGSRADYGIVRNYLNYLNQDKNIHLDILVTGALLEEKYGSGYTLIENDGFNIASKIPLHLDSTSNVDIIRSMSIALEKIGEYFENNHYDLLIILGDRYEMLSVAIAGAMNRIPILHIHGGEITLGNYDDFIRHSITKMSHYHFTSTEEYRNRVIQLGENPENVFYIGAMGSENCKTININNVPEKITNLTPKKYFVVLFHPETLTDHSPDKQIKELLSSIDEFINNYLFVFIGSNADTGSNAIRDEIKKYVLTHNNTIYFENLHPDAYHYLLKHSIGLIGNSSSGIIEAPTLGAYTINIGDRQKGRVRGTSVFDVECVKEKISNIIQFVIGKDKHKEFSNPYYKGNSSKEAYILTLDILNRKSTLKSFYDIYTSDE